ncbi:hypothetical protein DIE22_12255 [Burkholderia sp. Bp9142]|nr:hypothetical protein DIE22_12255 [Burkholderia sp. Bp9142]RQR55105.1 hypothetical protein DIE21_06645 [Burkholderia sp. Bp9140]
MRCVRRAPRGQAEMRMTPTLTSFAAPRGGGQPPWGGPAEADMKRPPRSLRSLPPEGAVSLLGAARRRLT